MLRRLAAGLRGHTDEFGFPHRRGHGHRGDRSGTNTRNGRRDFFQHRRDQILAALDDNLFLPAGDEQCAIGHVAQIAGANPAVLECCPGRGLISVVA